MFLPALPVKATPWSPSVCTAFGRLDTLYHTASAYIEGASMAPHRLEIYSNSLISDAFPILLLMEEAAEQEGIPMDWLNKLANLFTELYVQVQEHLLATDPTYKILYSLFFPNMQLRTEFRLAKDGVEVPTPVTSNYTGKRGRPRKDIDPKVLYQAFGTGRQISVNALARALGVHKNTLHAKIKELGINTGYDDISDNELDSIISKYRQENPDGGRAYTMGYIRSKYGARIQGPRIIASMKRVDKLGQGLREHVGEKKKHDAYSVPRPNSLWHIDGHHKLILWGIVIHGVADGYSRTVTGLRASGNNSAETVLEMFLGAIKKYGVPSRVRGDRGGENRDVSILMILLRGLRRASFMWGSSVFNTRIERLWVEVGRRFARAWRAFFLRLERMHLLDRRNKNHRWLLHYLFLDLINNDCDAFCKEWNAHPISGAAKNKSPNDIFLMGQLQHGVYDDPTLDMDANEVNRFYGFDDNGEPLDINEVFDSQAVDSDDDYNMDTDYSTDEDMEGLEWESDDTPEESDASRESESDDDNVNEPEIEEAEPGDTRQNEALERALEFLNTSEAITDSNIRHDAVPVPSRVCPFNDSTLELFEKSLSILKRSGDLPPGYGITPSEWPSSSYPTTETISIGLRKKSFPISLPDSIWRPRAETWTQALFIMDQILHSTDPS